jgi:hypothetical protein
VTLDRNLRYRPARNWSLANHGARYFSCDTTRLTGRDRSMMVLELKCLEQVPAWMANLVRQFNLTQSGSSKYGLAMDAEADFLPLVR